MKKIYKYPMEIDDEQAITMPVGANILCVQAQNYKPCLWALIDTGVEEVEKVVVRIVGTGHPFEDASECRYIGTIQLGSLLVFHVFRKI